MQPLTPEFLASVTELRARRQLHIEVGKALVENLGVVFPEWVPITEIGQTCGGRNDLVLFEAGGESVCFELFASRHQVDRDLLLLRDSPARHKVAILLDREVDASVVEAYYRKRPAAPYPCVWVSDVLLVDRRNILEFKLAQFVLGDQFARSLEVSRQLQQSAPRRILRSWRKKGIDVFTGDRADGSTFVGVMSFLAVSRMHQLGLRVDICEAAARTINEHFDFIVHQVLYGVPLFLVWDGQHCALLDFGDYECWLPGAISSSNADRVVVLLNTVYERMRSAYLGELPEPGDMARILQLQLGARSLVIREHEAERAEET